MNISPSILNFSRGEISPSMTGRLDLPYYYSGCQTLENFHPTPEGGLRNRNGSVYVGEVKDSTKKARLIAYEYSVDHKYILEFGSYYIRFYTNHEQIEDGGSPLEIATPYKQAEVFELSACAIENTLYIAHINHQLHKLVWTDDTTWSFETVDLKTQVWDSTIQYYKGDKVTYEDGEYIALYDNQNQQPLSSIVWEYRLSCKGLSGDITEYNPASSYSKGDFVIYRGKSSTSRHIFKAKINNPSDDPMEYEEDDDDDYRWVVGTGWKMVSGNLGSGCTDVYAYNAGSTYNTDDYVHSGGGIYISTQDSNIGNQPTTKKYWELDSIDPFLSVPEEYPSVVSYHNQRLILGASTKNPLTFWGSVVAEPENFTMGSRDSDGYQLKIASNKANKILWILSHEHLVLGTAGAEWAVFAEGGITSTNVEIKKQSSYGSCSLACVLNDAVLFVSKSQKTIRELFYSADNKNYQAPKVTFFSNHITESGIVDMDYQQSPDPILWCVRNDGEIACMTYDRLTQVYAWNRQVTDGDYESTAVITSDDGNDEVWAVVKRTINGSEKRFVEYFSPKDFDELKYANYLDCSVLYDDVPTDTVTGLNHLEGKTVGILADGFNVAPKVVTGGQITLDSEYSTIRVGLPYTSKLRTINLDFLMNGGSTTLNQKRIYKAGFKVYDSLGGNVRCNEESYETFFFRTGSWKWGDPINLFTGVKDKEVTCDYSNQVSVEVVQELPLPMNILSVELKMGVS